MGELCSCYRVDFCGMYHFLPVSCVGQYSVILAFSGHCHLFVCLFVCLFLSTRLTASLWITHRFQDMAIFSPLLLDTVFER